MSSTDVERLQPSSPQQRSRCMDLFLLGSVITLFIMLLSGAALGFWVVKDLRARTESLTRNAEPIIAGLSQHRGGVPDLGPSYKMENFAYLNTDSSELKNGSMLWHPIKYGNTTSVGKRYEYISNQGVLKMKQEGTYFLYAQLNLTCTGPCANGSLSIIFNDENLTEQLYCSIHLHLPKTPSGHLVEKCWTVMPRVAANTRLMARMHARVVPKAWRLDLNHSGFGIFLVDGS
ncbi:uncharacterized protein LOC124377838 [Silurus meridionalis]|uniref:TNF family profile domain-containing protein n=1 Tax=Silurus meridionalis TaxID=175797 RepID=A0A8T0AAR6_SILME|nr:uncharacterized protein LOC124377838 [Silurus meridionalis]KAF7689217.1 hypothetical protein HF521_012570 [Silurus meridionalis]